MADKLRVLLLNDEREKLTSFQSLLDIDHAREPEQAQEYFLKSLGTDQSYDIVACDVNFAESETVKQFVRGSGQDAAIVPLGPILALPFLGSDNTTFVSYSSFWPIIRHNPDIMLLSAFGMIEARQKRARLELSSIAERLRGFEEQQEGAQPPGSFKTALARGLREYRLKLFSNPSRLIEVGWLGHRLNALKEQNVWPPAAFQEALADVQCGVARDPDAPPVHTLLRDNDGVLSLGVDRVNRSRSIALASLYADYFLSALNPNDVTGMATSESIYVNALLAITNDLEVAKDLPGGSMEAFSIEVAETLKHTDQDVDSWRKGDTLISVLNKRRVNRAKTFPNVEDGIFIRACVLGAWLKAWRLYLDGNIPKNQIKPAQRRLLGIAPADKGDNNDATTNYRRLFMIDNKNEPKRDVAGEISWSAPFRNDKEKVERWNLDTNENANLTPTDKSFCEAFAALPEADGGLDWTTGADGNQAPIWMTTLA